ncbi:MAG: manganese efflux pump MntP family protein [Oscillospiraceae bacterium]|jgi:putative Mn2+ efflux pump MntP|nr:manganese efflux pump MntP family protein [Oscillospiraceae bacterium]
MGFLELLMLSVALAMDAFSVAVCKGLCSKKINYKNMLIIAGFFGAFQAIMPLIGWFLGNSLKTYIVAVDHWIVFGLLLALGAKMIWDALKGEDEAAAANSCEERLNLKELTVMAIATSIDALAVGITLAFLKVNMLLSVSVIGIVTFVISALGVLIGNKFGAKYQKPATVTGGAVLILIGVKILLEHLGVF